MCGRSWPEEGQKKARRRPEEGQKKARRRSGDDPAMICVFDGREMGAGVAGGRPLRVSVKKNLLISRLLADVPVFLLFLVWKYVAVSYLCTPQTKGCGQFFEALGRVFPVGACEEKIFWEIFCGNGKSCYLCSPEGGKGGSGVCMPGSARWPKR